MNSNALIVVAGATGLQGGATARQLLQDGFRVRGISRDPSAPAARALTTRGVEMVAASFDDRAALDRALAGADGVFIMATPFGKGGDVAIEERHGRALADAAKAANVAHVVYSSVGGAERNSGVPHFESKWRVEEHIRAIGLRATMLRPAVFMDMLMNASLGMRAALHGMFRAMLGAHKPLQLVAVDDIAVFASIAFGRPDEFAGRALELAGDAVTIPQMASTYRSVTGKRFGYVPLPRALVRRMPDELSLMMKWFAEHGFAADIPALRALHPQLLSWEQCCRRRTP